MKNEILSEMRRFYKGSICLAIILGLFFSLSMPASGALTTPKKEITFSAEELANAMYGDLARKAESAQEVKNTHTLVNMFNESAMSRLMKHSVQDTFDYLEEVLEPQMNSKMKKEWASVKKKINERVAKSFTPKVKKLDTLREEVVEKVPEDFGTWGRSIKQGAANFGLNFLLGFFTEGAAPVVDLTDEEAEKTAEKVLKKWGSQYELVMEEYKNVMEELGDEADNFAKRYNMEFISE